MRTYGQYCPIARASELLHERWTVIILRNIVLVGCRSFNEIAEGAPGLSRGLLSTRLRDLEHAGVIEIRRRTDGPGSTYEPTEAGRELSEVMLALQRWGTKWVELKPEHAHPGVVLWAWATLYLVRERLPRRRVLVRFDYPTLSAPGSRSWLLIEKGDAEICGVPRRRGGPRRRGQRSRSVRALALGRDRVGAYCAGRDRDYWTANARPRASDMEQFA